MPRSVSCAFIGVYESDLEPQFVVVSPFQAGIFLCHRLDENSIKALCNTSDAAVLRFRIRYFELCSAIQFQHSLFIEELLSVNPILVHGGVIASCDFPVAESQSAVLLFFMHNICPIYYGILKVIIRQIKWRTQADVMLQCVVEHSHTIKVGQCQSIFHMYRYLYCIIRSAIRESEIKIEPVPRHFTKYRIYAMLSALPYICITSARVSKAHSPQLANFICNGAIQRS